MADGEGAESKDRLIQELQQELAATKEYLQAVIEDLESTNEELRAANEEILSVNEEFQSVNEELETAKEELQSANEELSTMNDELQTRNAELGQMTNDLPNLLASSNIPILMLDPDLKIRLLTPGAGTSKLIPADLGKSLGDINLKIRIPDLEMQARKVMETLNARAQEVQDREGRWYSLLVKPYRTVEDRIEGAVLLLIDIDAQKTAAMEVGESRDFIQAVFQTMRESLLVLDRDLRVRLANQVFYKTFKVLPEETRNRFIYDLGQHQWDIPELRKLLEEVLPKTSLQDYRLEHKFPAIGERDAAERQAHPAAKCVNFAEQPARLTLDDRSLLVQWKPAQNRSQLAGFAHCTLWRPEISTKFSARLGAVPGADT